ncbi:N-acetylmuramoyl-L-alanine amidase [Deinococcus sp. YIM 134068]|uniref:N-acetylmuramoyl-L-alanine amidase family protein n=1 Tax=Deinococcus lichenicola TaxID=3118910 RepID=UPI002F95BAAC
MRLPLLVSGLTVLLGTSAVAVPRVGTHAGFTRVVFTLPKTTTASMKVSGQTATVSLGLSLPAEQGSLNALGITGYAVTGRMVTLTLAKGHAQAKASVLPATSGQPARLVIDVPTGTAAARVPARPAASPTAVVTRPVSRQAARPRVVLDPGHGGNDSGMASAWVREADVNLAVSLLVRQELVKRGVDVVMTRSSDRHLNADKRTDLDLRSRLATTGTVSAFVRIHTNASGPGVQGIETFYFGQPLAGQGRSTAVFENGGGAVGEALTRSMTNSAQGMLGDLLAQAKLSFSRQLAQQVQSNLIRATGAVSRGVRTDAFYVISNPTTPAVLIELGFGSHPVEGPKLAQPVYRQRLAGAISKALLAFLNIK